MDNHSAASSNTAPTTPSTSGTTITSAIDLTDSPPRPATRQLPPIPPPTDRRTSEFVLPKWQADAEVTHCPVCKIQFTFFYRKHHCRKCGRVVCTSCSPHRITIPRQFIVRPPDPPSAIVGLTGSDGDTSPLSPRICWGGEEVRVCNPCVPDPNLSPPPQNAFSPAGSPGHYRYMERPTPPNRHRTSSAVHPPHRPDHGHRSTLSDAAIMTADPRRSLPHDPLRYGHQFTNPTSVRDLWPPTAPPGRSVMFPPRTPSASGSGVGLAPSPFPYRSMLDTSAPLPPVPQPARRQIAEEDECPICGSELPPKGPNGDETAREGHISDCVKSHEYVPTPPSHPTPNPLETGPIASSSAPSASSSSLPAGSFSSASGSGPLRQRRMTGGRMLVYHATEKDCVGEDQEPTECVICFEEFDEGDEMGRLECLCKFHRTCIRQWWDTKGVGSCPTHQLHN
ncbi:FYVE-domain-containing protein [Venturia nashicola]|nr:FYVE-domain-containing protein [Venturia nashicola]